VRLPHSLQSTDIGVEGGLIAAIELSETAKAKSAFTEEDVYARASLVLEKAIVNGTARLRTFVEVDPRAVYRSLDAIKRLKADYADEIEVEIWAFAQERLTNEPTTEAMLETALASGADLVGGCPYTDPQPAEHIRRIFDLGERFGVPVDFPSRLNFHFDPRLGPSLASSRIWIFRWILWG
jgi:cytosine/creatinine deaminase